MAGISLEFAQFGHFDSFDIIRSMTSMVGVADGNLPAPIVTGLKTMYYVDTNVIKDRVYFYKVRVNLGGVSLVSSEIKAYAIPDSAFIFRSPFSTNIIDEKSKIWTNRGNAVVSNSALSLPNTGSSVTDYLKPQSQI